MRQLKRFSKTQIGQKFIGSLFFIITKLIYISISWKSINNSQKITLFKDENSYIFCCWHNKLFLGPHLLPRNKVINALQSSHSDGMITSVAFKYLGMKVILGSSFKGGLKAFRKMVKCIKTGESIAITPDGPRGPKEKVKDGVIKLAQITNAPIIPLVWSTKKYKKIKSWDEFIIPFPFTKGLYIFGEPMYINKKLNKKEFELTKLKIEKEMKRLTLLADQSI